MTCFTESDSAMYFEGGLVQQDLGVGVGGAEGARGRHDDVVGAGVVGGPLAALDHRAAVRGEPVHDGAEPPDRRVLLSQLLHQLADEQAAQLALGVGGAQRGIVFALVAVDQVGEFSELVHRHLHSYIARAVWIVHRFWTATNPSTHPALSATSWWVTLFLWGVMIFG